MNLAVYEPGGTIQTCDTRSSTNPVVYTLNHYSRRRVPNIADDFPAICVGRCQIPLAAPGLAGRTGITRVNDVIGKQTNHVRLL